MSKIYYHTRGGEIDIRNVLEKLKPVLIIIALFALAFYIRAEAGLTSGGVPSDGKDFYTGPDGLPYSVRWTPTTTTGSP